MSPLFLRLIHPFPIKEPLKVQKNDLQEIKALSLNHNLFPLIYTQLQRYRNSISPEEYVTDFLRKTKTLYLKSIALSAQQESVENEIIALLADKGMPSEHKCKGSNLSSLLKKSFFCHCERSAAILPLIKSMG